MPRRPISARDEFGHAESVLDGFALTPREHEVLRCMLEGMSITAIARKFSRAVATISAQKHSALRKLGLRSTHELFRLRYHGGVESWDQA